MRIGNASGGAGTGKAHFDEFTVQKGIDRATPALFKAVTAGTQYPTVHLRMRKAGAGGAAPNFDFLTYTFGAVFVTKVTWSDAGDVPTESVSFNFKTLKVEYTPQKPDGSPDTPISTCFDITTQTAC